MREIKFRAWHKNKPISHKQMEYEIQDATDVNSTKTFYPNFGCYLEAEKRGDCIVMQFTELKDKNGKEIYEGDILSYEFPNPSAGYVQEIKWQEDMTECCQSSFDGYETKNIYAARIIGNIYENQNKEIGRKRNE